MVTDKEFENIKKDMRMLAKIKKMNDADKQVLIAMLNDNLIEWDSFTKEEKDELLK